MSDSCDRDVDPHSLFQISQNEKLGEETRDWAAQRLRELSAGSVHVPPSTALATPSQEGGEDIGTNGDPTESQPTNYDRRKTRVSKNRPRVPVTIPENVEIIVISSDSEGERIKLEGERSLVNLNPARQHGRRRRIYHPDTHTNTCWRCPVITCRRHNPDFGFQKNAYVKRHIRNRHANQLVYACIVGCSVAFSNERAWERHHRLLHADEIIE